ncbi:hypothetical protein LQV05_006404 [Cryptococcus neoformans]|nr:hypothetical protein LQV05_006404 [Cryptococcus neoformans]
MFSQNPARSIQDRPDENAVSPIDDIWDRATPDDSFGSDTEDSDEEGEDLAARDTPFGDREGQEGDSQTTRDEGINAELFCAAQKGRSRMNKSIKAALNKFLSAQRKAFVEFCVQHDVRLASAERYANTQKHRRESGTWQLWRRSRMRRAALLEKFGEETLKSISQKDIDEASRELYHQAKELHGENFIVSLREDCGARSSEARNHCTMFNRREIASKSLSCLRSNCQQLEDNFGLGFIWVCASVYAEDNIQQTFATRNATVFVDAVKEQLDLPSLAADMGSILNGDRATKGKISRLLAGSVTPGTNKENLIKFKCLMKESMDQALDQVSVTHGLKRGGSRANLLYNFEQLEPLGLILVIDPRAEVSLDMLKKSRKTHVEYETVFEALSRRYIRYEPVIGWTPPHASKRRRVNEANRAGSAGRDENRAMTGGVSEEVVIDLPATELGTANRQARSDSVDRRVQ